MANPVFSAILDEQIGVFRTAFAATAKRVFYDPDAGKLIHPGEFGTYREAVVREFMRFFVPQRLAIQTGFLMTSTGDVSTQCDVVVYDRNNTPLIESEERQRFFPVETVCAIGQVKSDVGKSDLKAALNKLARMKALREQIVSPVVIRREIPGAFDPLAYAYDQIPSFLVCQKLTFTTGTLAQDIGAMYDGDIEIRHRHNMVLSLDDGIALYVDKNAKTMMFPAIQNDALKSRFVTPGDNPNVHIHLFCSYLFLMASSATVLYADVGQYMPAGTGGFNHDEQ